ncbi:MAG: ThiF family adenylyltransferase, partial [Lachnospiraceae bacterium]|nr:ThiF family adenylyltransferase [Lachnospiraceae bacterium]
MDNQFCRTEMLLGKEAMEMLKNARVAIFGIGGVGGHTVEALARCGVGAFDLIDNDTVCFSNLNRQIIATVVDLMEDHKSDKGDTRRIGGYVCTLNPESKAAKAYGIT